VNAAAASRSYWSCSPGARRRGRRHRPLRRRQRDGRRVDDDDGHQSHDGPPVARAEARDGHSPTRLQYPCHDPRMSSSQKDDPTSGLAPRPLGDAARRVHCARGEIPVRSATRQSRPRCEDGDHVELPLELDRWARSVSSASCTPRPQPSVRSVDALESLGPRSTRSPQPPARSHGPRTASSVLPAPASAATSVTGCSSTRRSSAATDWSSPLRAVLLPLRHAAWPAHLTPGAGVPEPGNMGRDGHGRPPGSSTDAALNAR
jgi:hypothetical protein